MTFERASRADADQYLNDLDEPVTRQEFLTRSGAAYLVVDKQNRAIAVRASSRVNAVLSAMWAWYEQDGVTPDIDAVHHIPKTAAQWRRIKDVDRDVADPDTGYIAFGLRLVYDGHIILSFPWGLTFSDRAVYFVYTHNQTHILAGDEWFRVFPLPEELRVLEEALA